MALIKELRIQSFVLLSKKPNDFNPANFNQYWLDTNNIISASKIDKNSTFSPQAVQVLSENMNLIVTPDQIQIAPNETNQFNVLAKNNICSLVNNMDSFDLNGLGLNFGWFLFDDKISSQDLTRNYFYNSNNPSSSFFTKDESLFGNYFSKQIDADIRLKLDIKPVHLFDAIKNTKMECIQFAFNFHSDLKNKDQKEEVISILGRIDDYYNISAQIMDLYN